MVPAREWQGGLSGRSLIIALRLAGLDCVGWFGHCGVMWSAGGLPCLAPSVGSCLEGFLQGHERFFDNNAVTMCFDYSAGEQNRNEDTNQNERSEHVCLPY